MKNSDANLFPKTTIVIRFNLLQVCPRLHFVFTVLFTFFDVLSGLFFYVSLNLMADPTV